MDNFKDYLASIPNEFQRVKMDRVLNWVCDAFPDLGTRIAWSNPTFTDHGTHIASFNCSKKHLSLSAEPIVISTFSERIKAAGFTHTQMLVQFPWDSDVDFELIEAIIRFNIEDKKDVMSFWRS